MSNSALSILLVGPTVLFCTEHAGYLLPSDWFTNSGIGWLHHSLHMRRALKLSLCNEMLVQGFQIQVFLSIAPARRLYIAQYHSTKIAGNYIF